MLVMSLNKARVTKDLIVYLIYSYLSLDRNTHFQAVSSPGQHHLHSTNRCYPTSGGISKEKG